MRKQHIPWMMATGRALLGPVLVIAGRSTACAAVVLAARQAAAIAHLIMFAPIFTFD